MSATLVSITKQVLGKLPKHPEQMTVQDHEALLGLTEEIKAEVDRGGVPIAPLIQLANAHKMMGSKSKAVQSARRLHERRLSDAEQAMSLIRAYRHRSGARKRKQELAEAENAALAAGEAGETLGEYEHPQSNPALEEGVAAGEAGEDWSQRTGDQAFDEGLAAGASGSDRIPGEA
jgi:hypothetical protein